MAKAAKYQPTDKERAFLDTVVNGKYDRQIITGKVTQFGEEPSFSLVPPGMVGYVPFSPEYADWAQEEREHEARRLYEQAGFSREQPLRVEIRYNTSDNHRSEEPTSELQSP